MKCGIRLFLMTPILAGCLVSGICMAEPLHDTNSIPKVADAVKSYYEGWKKHYLKPSLLVPGNYKIAFNPAGTTVSEAMGYGMLITVLMADDDQNARHVFDGLNRFRKRYPSSINPEFMAWKIPSSEKKVSNDSATDGDMDCAMALLLAFQKWGDPSYHAEAVLLIHALGAALIRPDFSLRLGDWDTDNKKPELIRLSDLMPTHFRVFHEATGDERWKKVEEKSYAILAELQHRYAPETGLIPDFAELNNGSWHPAKPRALEGPHDGDYSYNSCRVPWRIGSAALEFHDDRAIAMLNPLVAWMSGSIGDPEDFKAGYHLNGKMLKGADFDSPCFIAPTGVAAMAVGNKVWQEKVLPYGLKAHEGYYEDSVDLLCLLVMTGKAELR